MNDLIIKVSKRSRLIDLDHSTLGIVGENLQEKLIFTFQDEFVDGMARLEYELDNEKHYVLMEKVGQSYILPVQNVLLTKEGNIDLQLVITEDKTGTPVFKSEVFTLYCKKSIEAVGEAPSSYELWIEKANRILLEASRVNIDGKKTGNETLITITQRDGNKKNFSILDGQDGQDGQDGNGIVSIEKTSTSTLVDTYTITFTDGTTTTFEVTNGNGIVSIEKTSTSGLVDTYTITFSDGTTTTYTVTNGETQDLSNYVQKPEFNESQAEQDTTTRELQAELDRYKLLENALPHTENETPSDYVTLENTAKSPMEVSLTPQTSQETTTGKNKANINNVTTTSTTNWTINVSGNTLSITHNNEYTTGSPVLNLGTLPSGTYYLSGTLGSTISLYINNSYSKVLSSGSSFECDGTQDIELRFSANAFASGTTLTYTNLMIATDTGDYEPYTGGIPAPNPDFPMNIHRTTGENQVKVVGKNLIDYELYPTTDFVTNIIYNKNSVTATFNGSYRGSQQFYDLENGKTYTISVGEITNSSARIEVRFIKDGVILSSPTQNVTSNQNYTFTVDKSLYDTVRIGISNGNLSGTNTITFNKIQLEQSSSATSYTPYESTTYPISLGNKEMYNVNNVSDGFVYDEAPDKFYINRKIGKVVLNGSENWAYNAAYTFFHVPNSSTPNISSNEVFTNYYKYFPNISGIVGAYGCSVYQNAFRVKNTDYTNVNDFKSWLSTHNTIVVYQLVNATLEEITDTTLISQLRAIKNALSMQGTTHIISTASGSNLPFLIKARAVQTIERT